MSEDEEQIALFRWTEYQKNRVPELELLFHIPNEGKRSPQVGSKMKKMGMKAGVPDLFFPVPRGKYHGLFIELKAGKGRATENQKAWLKRLSRQGYCAAICYGWQEAANCIQEYLRLKTEVET